MSVVSTKFISGSGTAGQVLTSNGPSSAPSYQTATFTAPNSEIWLYSQNGYGSSNTAVRQWNTIGKNIGSDLTLTQSAVDGDKITINTAGIYSISYSDDFSNGADLGIVLNGTQGNIVIYTITGSDILAISSNKSSAYSGSCSVTLHLSVNDYVWAQTDMTSTGTFGIGSFRVTRVA